MKKKGNPASGIRDGLWRKPWASNTSSLTYGSQSAAPPGTGCWSGGHRSADIPSPQRPTCVGVSCTYSSETGTSPIRIHKPPCLKRGESGCRSPKVDGYSLFLLHKVAWMRLRGANYQSGIQIGKCVFLCCLNVALPTANFCLVLL